jgi:hypothetical protein
MYLSADRLAIANRAVQDTFEQASVVWQAIPHWDTGDPGQTRVRNDATSTPGSIPIETVAIRFPLTLAQAIAPTPDALLAAVMARTVELAQQIDDAVLPKLRDAAKDPDIDLEQKPSTPPLPSYILGVLIDARARVEDAGYRAPSCLFTNTAGLKALSTLASGVPVTESLLDATNINSLHRVKKLDDALDPKNPEDTTSIRLLLLGRRQRIAHRGAADASPGEEPVDVAVSVFPSLEVVGETAAGKIELAVRIRYALRIKDVASLVAVIHKVPANPESSGAVGDDFVPVADGFEPEVDNDTDVGDSADPDADDSNPA